MQYKRHSAAQAQGYRVSGMQDPSLRVTHDSTVWQELYQRQLAEELMAGDVELDEASGWRLLEYDDPMAKDMGRALLEIIYGRPDFIPHAS